MISGKLTFQYFPRRSLLKALIRDQLENPAKFSKPELLTPNFPLSLFRNNSWTKNKMDKLNRKVGDFS